MWFLTFFIIIMTLMITILYFTKKHPNFESKYPMLFKIVSFFIAIGCISFIFNNIANAGDYGIYSVKNNSSSNIANELNKTKYVSTTVENSENITTKENNVVEEKKEDNLPREDKKSEKIKEESDPYELALNYENGIGVERDYKLAFEYYQKASNAGNDKAQYRLAMCYELGYGTDIDMDKAMQWYKKSTDKGNIEAQSRYNYLVEQKKKREGIANIENKDEENKKIASQNENVKKQKVNKSEDSSSNNVNEIEIPSSNNLSNYQHKKEENTNNYQNIENNNNVQVATNNYQNYSRPSNTVQVTAPKYEEPKYEAPKYEEPKYEEPKYEAPKYEEPKYEAPKYEEPKYEEPKYEPVEDYLTSLRTQAEGGNATSQYLLGLKYYNGDGVPRNIPTALHWFRQAANQGHKQAQQMIDKIENN